MDVASVGLEAQIDWNEPPLHMVDRLGEKTLDKIFGGRFCNQRKQEGFSSHQKIEGGEAINSFLLLAPFM